MNRIAIVMLAAAGAAWAQDAHQIMAEVQKRGHSESMHIEATLQTCPKPTCADSKGVLNTKDILIKRWVYDRIGDFGKSKAIVRFTGPAEVKGVALLIVNHPDAASDQWLWRPAVGRDQRIAIQDRSDKFFNTDFSFEDLEERDVDQYDYKLTGEITGKWTIEAKPRKASEYTRSMFYIDKTRYTFERVEAYNKKGLAKSIDYGDFQQVKGIWTSKAIALTDLQRKTRTTVQYDKVDFNIPVKESDFTVEALRLEK
jgi:outer membrane lipoprotein-sorting protein